MTDPAEDPDARWFRRFRFSAEQADAVRQQVERTCRTIDGGPASAELSSGLMELAWALTPLGRETEAAAFGRVALDLARATGDAEAEIEALLHTATALQYTGEPDEAQALFQAGIDRAIETGRTGNLHYLQHHLGRLAVEAFDPAGAGGLFEAALAQRRDMGDAGLVRSSEAALAELAPWIDHWRPGAADGV